MTYYSEEQWSNGEGTGLQTERLQVEIPVQVIIQVTGLFSLSLSRKVVGTEPGPLEKMKTFMCHSKKSTVSQILQKIHQGSESVNELHSVTAGFPGGYQSEYPMWKKNPTWDPKLDKTINK